MLARASEVRASGFFFWWGWGGEMHALANSNKQQQQHPPEVPANVPTLQQCTHPSTVSVCR